MTCNDAQLNELQCSPCARLPPTGLVMYAYFLGIVVLIFELAMSAFMFYYRDRPLIKYAARLRTQGLLDIAYFVDNTLPCYTQEFLLTLHRPFLPTQSAAHFSTQMKQDFELQP
jgi:hypothetical protein